MPTRAPAIPSVSAAAFIPQTGSLDRLREAAAACRGCDLYRHATQTVFGEGSAGARLMLVGEQPGDREDLAGRPFVGPAGNVLRSALHEAGIVPDGVYITNAVKHFKYIERGKRRIHASPKRLEIVACTPWLDAELRAVDPGLVVALGATAAQALLGPAFRLTRHRGEVVSGASAPHIVATIHPSSILRTTDAAARREMMESFVSDLRFAAATLDALSGIRSSIDTER